MAEKKTEDYARLYGPYRRTSTRWGVYVKVPGSSKRVPAMIRLRPDGTWDLGKRLPALLVQFLDRKKRG